MNSDCGPYSGLLTVGLTGGIACGKTNILRHFKRLGARTIDADQLARDVVEPGREAHREVVAAFGPLVLQSDGGLDRRKLASLVFADEQKRERLNSILHPRIIAEENLRMEQLSRGEPALVVVDAALMIEVGTYLRYEVIVVAFCPPDVQVERIMKRDKLSREEARQRLESQMPIQQKVRFADYVIDTSGPFERTAEEVERVYQELAARLQARARPDLG